MNLSVGIVGLPNVGKSTLFNALLRKQQAFVANYPFATIEPNIGVVPVPDRRLEVLVDIVGDEMLKQVQHDKKRPPIVPATVKFVDIAGLVQGAYEGAGLGNKFLSHIREVSVIAHVVRAFEDPNIIREGSVDAKSDYQTIQTELILADLQTLENSKLNPRFNRGQKSKIQLKSQNLVIEKIINELNKGIAVRSIHCAKEEREFVDQFFLLSAKPEIVVLNVSEEDYSSVISTRHLTGRNPVGSLTDVRDDRLVAICAKIESELSELSEEEQKEYLKDLGLQESGLERLIKKAYETLALISFLTAGEKEVRAWTIEKGTSALNAAGEIHTDFTKNFIKAEVVSYEDFISLGGWKKAREKGKTRLEGKDYVMQDGDVVEFKIGQ